MIVSVKATLHAFDRVLAQSFAPNGEFTMLNATSFSMVLLLLAAIGCSTSESSAGDDGSPTPQRPVEGGTVEGGTVEPGDANARRNDASEGSVVNGETDGSLRLPFTFSGTDFGVHDGQMLYVAVADPSLPPPGIIKTDSTTVQQGAFSFTWPALLKEGLYYAVSYYVDVNASGTCDTPPTDHAWSAAANAVAPTPSLSVVHSTNFHNVCSSF